MKYIFAFFSVVGIILSAHSTPVFSQAITSVDVQQELSVSIIPEIPKAKERVTITLQSYSYNLNTARISWSQNGKAITSGTGYTTFTFDNGTVGTVTTVTATIAPQNGKSFSRTFSFNPTDIAIIWQADTYTPPLYAGKALFVDGASITASAIPDFVQNGKKLSRDTLVYAWTLDGDPLVSKSGYGKHTITIVGNTLGSEQTLSVSVSSSDGSLQGVSKILLTPQTPMTVLYENHPLFGTLFNSALKNSFSLSQSEVSLQVVPYFFSDSEPFNMLDIAWSINGKKVEQKGNKESITLRNDTNAKGTATLGLQIVHAQNSFQNARTGLSINLSPQ